MRPTATPISDYIYNISLNRSAWSPNGTGTGTSSVQEPSQLSKITIRTFWERKRSAQKITVLTAYDYPNACLMDESGIDALLIGDSMGMAIMGLPDTLSVTLDDIIHHTKMVRRGV